jgi:CubicO group peptidase (beta-lactamase class C family)
MTKSFTCAALLTVRDEGLLRLDDSVVDIVPEFGQLRGPAADAPAITIRHLMTMSSGLANDDPWADRHLDMTDDQLDAVIDAGLTFAAVAGTTFEYSNLGFAILGRVVRAVTGATLQQLVSERLLGPLGMSDTGWTAPEGAVAGFRERTDDAAEWIVEPSLGDGVMAPMGGLFSTVDDLATWIGFFTSAFSGSTDGAAVPLSAASRREMQQVSRVFAATGVAGDDERRVPAGGYGYGLSVLPHARLGSIVSHSGGLPGFGSNMRWSPETGIGVLALSNLTYAPMGDTTAAVLEALCKDGAVSVAAPRPSQAVADAAAALLSLLDTWDDELAAGLFADNVDLDRPLTSRRAEATELRTDHGPFVLARIIAESGAAATVIAHGQGVELHLDFQLAPIHPPRVQYYGTKIVG